MAKIKLKFTEDQISLIKGLRFERINENIYGIDNYNLWGGTFIWEDMAYILGKTDKIVKGTEEDVTGPKYDDETMEYFKDLDAFIVDNIQCIVEILLQFCDKGGIAPGKTYWAYDYQHIWYEGT